jgi:16S rRNA (uracil1498-N3)-methyltransferase
VTGRPARALEIDPGLRCRPLVFVDDLDRPELSDNDRHHLERVLRLAGGDLITVGDGAGGWRSARLGSSLEPTGPVHHLDRPQPPLTVAFAPVKGAKAEWVVQKLTELGVDRIAPVFTERSVVRWDPGRFEKLRRRLEVTATEACHQSRRLHRPRIDSPLPLPELVGLSTAGLGPGTRTGAGVVLADPLGGPVAPAVHTIVIGPEGGFAPAERELAATIELPGGVLRAETAVVAAATVLVAVRDGLLSPSG